MLTVKWNVDVWNFKILHCGQFTIYLSIVNICIYSNNYKFTINSNSFKNFILFYFIGSKGCLETVLDFLKNCLDDGSVKLSMDTIKNSKIKVTIPER